MHVHTVLYEITTVLYSLAWRKFCRFTQAYIKTLRRFDVGLLVRCWSRPRSILWQRLYLCIRL